MKRFVLIPFAITALGANYFRTAGRGMVDPGTSMQRSADGGYILVGYTWSYGAGSGNILLIKTNGLGQIQWSRTIGGSAQEYGTSVIQTSDGGYAVVGLTYSYGAGSYNILLAKLTSAGALEWARVIGGREPSLMITGNRVSFTLASCSRVKLSVYDPAGRLAMAPVDGFLGAGEHTTTLEGLAKGVYMVELVVDNRRTVGKAMVR